MRCTTRSASTTANLCAIGRAITLGCAVAALLSLCGGIATAAAPIASPALDASSTPPPVAIVDFAFRPDTITIHQHEVVTWRNDGPSTHTVTADDGSFGSGKLAPGDQFANVFDAAGTIRYHCSIHPAMVGTVVVEAVAATTTPSGPTPPPGTLTPSFNMFVTPPPTTPASAVAPSETSPATPAATPGSTDGGPSIAVAVPIALILVAIAFVAYLAVLRRQRR